MYRMSDLAEVTSNRVIRALVVIDGLGWGGAEMLLPDFVQAASSVDIDVSVAYLYDKDGGPALSRLRAIGVEPAGLRVGGLLDPRSLRMVTRHVAEMAPDVVHTHLGYSDLLGGIGAALCGVPVVSTIHVTQGDSSPRGRVKEQLIAGTRRSVTSRVIAVSEASRDASLERGWAAAERLVTIHNGIAGVARPGAGRVVREELGLGQDDAVVGMLTVLRPGKGHDVAVEAIASLRSRIPRLRLLIAGDGPMRCEVERLASRLGNAAIMVGHRDDVMEIVDAMDVLLLPSVHEAFPTALLEAMAGGVPAVATAVGGVPEIIVDGVTGALVSPPASGAAVADALLALLQSREMRDAAGRAARRRFADEFSVERHASRVRQLYEQVIEEGPRSGLRRIRARRLPLSGRGNSVSR